MKKGYNFFGFLFIAVLGTLLHFLYGWCSNNPIVGTFSAINESTWEHLKLFYFPFLIYSVYEYYRYGKEICGFFSIKLKSLLLNLGFIIVFFYTYRGILGFDIGFLNIAEFFIAIGISRIYESKAVIVCNKKRDKYSLISILIIGLLFVIFTFITPPLGIFAEPT